MNILEMNSIEMNSIEIICNGPLEQIDKFVALAEEEGYKTIHIRHCFLKKDEIKAIKKKHAKITLFIDNDEEYDVLCLAKDVLKGTPLTQEVITVKKGQNGLTPKFTNQINGKKILYDLPQGTILTFGYIEP